MCAFTWQRLSGGTTRHGMGLETAELLTGPVPLSALLLEGRDGKGGYQADPLTESKSISSSLF